MIGVSEISGTDALGERIVLSDPAAYYFNDY